MGSPCTRRPDRGSPHHVRRATRRAIENVGSGDYRIGHPALAPSRTTPHENAQIVIYLCAVPKPSISAFFPCYNDAKTIGDLVLSADCVLSGLTDDYEIIVVNDGSRDESAAVLSALSQQVSRL